MLLVERENRNVEKQPYANRKTVSQSRVRIKPTGFHGQLDAIAMINLDIPIQLVSDRVKFTLCNWVSGPAPNIDQPTHQLDIDTRRNNGDGPLFQLSVGINNSGLFQEKATEYTRIDQHK